MKLDQKEFIEIAKRAEKLIAQKEKALLLHEIQKADMQKALKEMKA